MIILGYECEGELEGRVGGTEGNFRFVLGAQSLHLPQSFALNVIFPIFSTVNSCQTSEWCPFKITEIALPMLQNPHLRPG